MFCFRFLVHLRQSWKKLSKLPNKTGVCLLQLLLGVLMKSEWIKCPPNYFFYCYFLCMGVLCFVWPPITQHGWQTPQRFHAASPHSQTEFHPVCRQLRPQTRCSIRLLCSSRSLMFLFLVSCLFFIKLKGGSIIQSIAFFLCVFSS